jgi:tetratricopeptide (TPR) repeat protein
MLSRSHTRIGQNILILIFLLVLILAPRPIAGWLDLETARRFESAKDYARAAPAYVNAAKRLFWRADLWQEAGFAAIKADRPEDAIASFVIAKEHAALTSDGWLALGDAYERTNDSSAAIAAWQSAGNVAEAYERLAKAHRAAGDFSTTMLDLQHLLALEPDNANAHYQLGLLFMASRPEDALPELLRAAQLDPSFDVHIQPIRTELNTALLSDDKAYRFLLAGHALAAQNEWDLALKAFRNAVSQRPDYAEAWAWLGEAEQHLGQDGFPALQKALLLDPASATVNVLTGMYYQRQGNPAKALAAYQAAVKLEPDNAAWHAALGGAYESNRDLLSALTEYQRAVELDPANVPAWQAMALYAVVNDSNLEGNGFTAARKLVELSPNDWQSLDIAGQVTHALGNLREARHLFEKAVELAPDQAAPHLHLALVFLDFKESDLAFAELKLAVSLDPNGPVGWQANRLLEQYFP